LLAKTIDGVYSADPKLDKTAVKYDKITYQEVLEKDLKVMDSTATALCKDNNIPLLVFAINEPENIVKAINNFKPIDGRFKVLRNIKNNITVIDDTYNSCFESVINGLKISSNMLGKRKIAVLGTIGSGANGKDDTSIVHEQVGQYFKDLNFDYLYLTGDYTKHTFKTAMKYFSEQNIKRFKDKQALLQALSNTINDGDLIYIKDAGLQGFEKIIYELKQKYYLV